LGTPDPYIRVRVGTYAERTYTIQSGGCNALFEPLDTKLTVTAETLRSNKIEFEVWDENSKLDFRGDVMIGKGSRSLDDVRVLEEIVELSIPLTDSKGGPTGRLLAFLKLQNPPPKDPGTNSGINTMSGSETDLCQRPEINFSLTDFTEGTIHIRKIAVYGSENTEIFSMFGEKQDPYISLRVIGGNLKWERKTPVLNDGGENNTWELYGFEIDVTRHQLSGCVLEVTVKDKNKMIEDVIIGSGEIEFKIVNKLNTVLEIPVTLKSTNKKGVTKNKSTGRLVCYIELKNREKKECFLQQGFQNGKIEILKIQTYDLKNTEIGLLSSNHNPYCKLKLGDTQNAKTGTLKNAGENFSWEELTVKFDVTSILLMQSDLEVSFYDDNVLCKDRLLGEGKASLLQCGARIGEVVNFTVYLLDGKARPCGRAVIHAKISEEGLDDYDVITSEEFVDGNIRIKRITVSDVAVNNGLLLSASQLYIKMKMESFNECTSKINQENSNKLIWNNLDYSIHFDKNTLLKKNVEVEVWRSSTFHKDVLIGTAIISMSKAGGNLDKEIEISQYLNFKKNGANNNGIVTLLCQLIPSKIVLKQAELGNKKKSNSLKMSYISWTFYHTEHFKQLYVIVLCSMILYCIALYCVTSHLTKPNISNEKSQHIQNCTNTINLP
jgi:C2 domain